MFDYVRLNGKIITYRPNIMMNMKVGVEIYGKDICLLKSTVHRDLMEAPGETDSEETLDKTC